MIIKHPGHHISEVEYQDEHVDAVGCNNQTTGFIAQLEDSSMALEQKVSHVFNRTTPLQIIVS